MKTSLLGATALVAIITGTPARSADLPAIKVPFVAPVWNWTGFYFGGHIGAGSAFKQWDDPTNAFVPVTGFPFTGKSDIGGSIGGGQIGFNYQNGAVVWGVEADASFADIEGDARCATAIFLCNAQITSLGTITGRLGFSWDHLLFYGKFGGAWAHEKYRANSFFFLDDFQATDTRWGWAIGAGLEYAFTSGLSVKVEYNYLDFGTKQIAFSNTGIPTIASIAAGVPLDIKQNMHLVKLGVNYRLDWFSPAVAAADPGPVRQPPQPVPYFSWTGLYIGGHFGAGWGRKDWTDPNNFFAVAPFPFSHGNRDVDGFIGGGQIGFNYQIGNWVAGTEVDASWSDIDGNAKCTDILRFVCHTRIDHVGTITGRLGYSYGNLLLYSKAGIGWAHDKYDLQSFFFPNIYTAEDTRWGGVIGTGVEWAFTPNWSVKAEYDYLGFRHRVIAFRDQFGNVPQLGVDQNLHLVKLGVNYRFGWGELVAPYPGAVPVYKGGPVYKAPAAPPLPEWTLEAGARYWFSNGKMQKDLYGFDPTLLVSRLTYADMNGHAAEAFARWDHRSGVLVKGNFGAGDLVNGKLNDEDFPPITNPYSNTLSDMKDGRMRYASLDVGYNFLNRPTDKAAAYVGYRHFHERVNGFGCQQVASGDVCNPPIVPATFLGLTETETWRGVALGLNGQVMLWDRLRLEVDAAYLPYVNRAGIDNHWFRADINPLIEPGYGWGAQLEAILSYAITDKLSMGVGGRYWAFQTTSAYTQFGGAPLPQPMTFHTERYGGFFQMSYKWDEWDLPHGTR